MKSAAFSEEWLEARLATLLPEFPDVSICVALSGGLDSVTLLAALAALRGPRGASPAARRLRAASLRAIHVHHGLHPNADKWAAHCSKLAKKLCVPLEIIKVQVPRARGGSLEAAARDARYAALADALRAGEVLLTAHHQDDQLETVLLQLMRGAGVPGLAAMPDVAPFTARAGSARLARPLLTRSRVDLEEWANAHELTWLDDDTNTDERFDRNYLRRTVLPLIRERWPGAGAAVSRTARHAAEARRLLDALALTDVERAAQGASLSTQKLRTLDPDRRRNALRYWIARAGFTVPDTRRLEELAGPLLDARADANPQVRWNDTLVERHADILSIRATAPLDPAAPPLAATSRGEAPQVWHWRESRSLALATPGGGTLSIEPDPHGPLNLDALPNELTIQRRQGGESLRPRAGARTRKLKALLQEAKIPPSQRDALALVYANGTLIAVSDRWLDASVQATRDTEHRGRLRFRS